MNTKTKPTVTVLYCVSCNRATTHEFNGRYNPCGKAIFVCDCCGAERAA